MKKITHVIESQDILYGGPAASVPYLAGACKKFNFESSILSADNDNSSNYIIEAIGLNWVKCGTFGPSKLKYSRSIFDNIVKDAGDVIHLHNLWNHVSYSALRASIKTGRPIVVSPRSGLYSDSLKNRAWVKKISSFMFHENLLSRASCLHVTSEDEMMHARKFGYKGPVALIPNIITVSNMVGVIESEDVFNVLYISRVHPRKNLVKTIDGFKEFLRKYGIKNAKLVVAGLSDDDHSNHIRSILLPLANDGLCDFYGFIEGTKKLDLFKAAGVFVLMSDFENFGMAIAESLSFGVPVICSDGCPWPDLKENDAGEQVSVNELELADAIYRIYVKWCDKNIDHENIKKYVNAKYDIDITSKMYVDLYDWVCNKSNTPKFVYRN